MIIFVDASRISDSKTNGVSRYATSLLREIVDSNRHVQLVLLSTRPILNPSIKVLLQSPLVSAPSWPRFFSFIPASFFVTIILSLYFAFFLPHRERIKPVFWGPSIFVPFFGIPTIATLHDYVHSYFRNTQSIPSIMSRIFIPLSLGSATKIANASRYTLHLSHLHSPSRRKKSFLVENTVNSLSLTTCASSTTPKALKPILDSNYILFVGSIEPRKNVPCLLQAFDQLSSRHPDLFLVIVYSNTWSSTNLFRSLPSLSCFTRIKLLCGTDDQSLSLLYKHALLTVCPSLYEGFGIPIFESLYYETPVLATEYSEILFLSHQLSSDSYITFNPYTDNLASKIDHALSSLHKPLSKALHPDLSSTSNSAHSLLLRFTEIC